MTATNMTATDIAFPFGFDAAGRTARSGHDAHVRGMLMQLLFTSPGERVNRPDFGSGLQQLVFSPNAPELAAALQFTMQAAIQRHLGDLIEVQALELTADDAVATIRLRYMIRATGERQFAEIVQPL